MSTASDTIETTGVATSADGTPIAWTRLGAGPDLVMIHCVGVSRATTMQPTLPGALAEHFTVWTYDRRGKGESGDTEPYDVQREVEDLIAVLEMAAGPVTVYGFSSGATLALIAAAAGAPIARLTVLEPPLFDDPDPDRALLAEGRRRLAAGPAELHRWFNVEVVGVPEEVMAQLPPVSEEILRDAPSLLHELEFLPGTPARRFASVRQPALFIASETTDPAIIRWGRELAEALPHGESVVVPGEWHGVDDATLTRLITGAAGVARTDPA
ncbi:alpha/beta fold hydrolase [Granulicoccus phenolivorans]|uniref:alpha/beta fold hydrolase n=1 Tax=Granulicoccus phenolivorans TaxID=266854 RepID=UPI0003FEAC8C|nr:alpha/beta hydrolase [Granulicoccus phenolivorans]